MKTHETPTHPELCENCNPLVESSKLEWVKVGGMNIGLYRQPLTWVLRDKYSDDVIKMNAKYSQRLAAKSRELADMAARLTTITEQRDKLAHELERITITGSAKYCRQIADETLQSLNQLKP